MVKQDRPVGPDGFAEGIITDKTENVIPVEEPEQDMTAVNEKAEQDRKRKLSVMKQKNRVIWKDRIH